MNRILTAARLHLVGWPVSAAWPWGILALSWLVNVAIYGALRYHDVEDGGFTGGLLSIYVVVFVGYVQAMTRGFSFALGLSLSRRSFYLGTVLVAVVEAVVYGAAIMLLRGLEDATDGWGLNLHYFGIPFVRQQGPVLQYLVYVVPFLLASALGMAVGAVSRRWGSNGVLTMSTALIGIGGLAATAATLWEWWRPIGRWFADQSAASLFAGWPALLAVAIAGAGWLAVRRTAAT